MFFNIKNISIVDIARHDDIGGLTGKVKFHLEDEGRHGSWLTHYVTVDVAVPFREGQSFEEVEGSLFSQATAVLRSALAFADQGTVRRPRCVQVKVH